MSDSVHLFEFIGGDIFCNIQHSSA